jgi:hypothetical protein
VGRIYKTNLENLPRVAVPDWELIAELESLLRPYCPVLTTGPRTMLTAHDAKGSYDAETTSALRELAAEQGDVPHTVAVYATSNDLDGQPRSFTVYTSSRGSSGGTLASHDEALLREIEDKVRQAFEESALPELTHDELQEQAALEYAEREAAGEGRMVNIVTDVRPAPSPRERPSFWNRHRSGLNTWAQVLVPVVLTFALGLLAVWLIGR